MSAPSPDHPPARRLVLNEDWLATLTGLALLVLILADILPGRLVP